MLCKEKWQCYHNEPAYILSKLSEKTVNKFTMTCRIYGLWKESSLFIKKWSENSYNSFRNSLLVVLQQFSNESKTESWYFSWVWRTERESGWPEPLISCNLFGSNSHIVPIEGITHSLNQSSPTSPSSFLGPPDNTIINPAGLLQQDTQKSFPAVLRSFMSQRSDKTSPLLDWQKGLITSKLCVW